MAPAMAIPAAAEWTPAGPLTLRIGFGAGGETDTLGRVLAAVIEEQTGWQVVAENKPGGGGVAMFTGIAAAPADGTVIGLGVTVPIMINLATRADQLPFTVDSFDDIGTVARSPLGIVAMSDAPFDDIAGLVDYAKKMGGIPASFDSKAQELISLKLNERLGAMIQPVPTRSGAEQMQLLLGRPVMIS